MTSLASTFVLALVQGAAGLPAAAPAPAAPSVIAVILPRSPNPSMMEALHRLRGEADSVGIEIRLVDLPAGGANAPPVQLDAVARTLSPAAVVTLVGKPIPKTPTEGGSERQGAGVIAAIDAWFLDGATGRTSVGHLTVEKDAGDQVDQVLAVRVVDFIRARMFESLVRRQVDEAKARQRPSVARTMDGRRCLTLGLAASGSADGFSPVLLPLVQVGFGLRPWLWLTLAGAGFGTQLRRETAAGSATVDQKSAAAGVVILPRAWWRVAPFVSAGASVLFVSVNGQGKTGYLGHDVSSWSPGAFASVGFVAMLTARLMVQVSGGALVLAHPPTVFIAGADVARTGRPAWLASTSLGVTF